MYGPMYSASYASDVHAELGCPSHMKYEVSLADTDYFVSVIERHLVSV